MSLPAYLQNLQVPDIGAALSANLGAPMPPSVSIEGGRFTLIDAGNNEIPVPTFDPAIGVYLDACIIDVNNAKSRVYYKNNYDSQAPGMRPDCFSDNGVGPSIHAGAPQGRTCQPDPDGVFGCKRAVWGSKINPNGKGVPACTEKQKIALLIPGFQTLFLLSVPPNSHGPLREYTSKCKGNNTNMADLITRISFVPNIQGTLQFAPVSYIDEPTAKLRQVAYVEKKTDDLVGRNDVPRPIGAIAAPARQEAPPLSQPVQIAAPQPGMPITPQGSLQWPNPSGTSTTPSTAAPAGTAPAASPSEPAPAQRRRRRTAAEMQEAQNPSPPGQPQGAAAGTSHAPFPHPGATVQGGTNAAGGNFGIAPGQPAAANPELSGMLDNFFGT